MSLPFAWGNFGVRGFRLFLHPLFLLCSEHRSGSPSIKRMLSIKLSFREVFFVSRCLFEPKRTFASR